MKVGLRFVAESRLPMTAQAATSTAVQARLARETHLLTGMTDFSTVVGASSLASPAIIAALPESGMFGKPEPFAYYSIRLRRGPSGPRSSARIRRRGNDAALDLAGGIAGADCDLSWRGGAGADGDRDSRTHRGKQCQGHGYVHAEGRQGGGKRQRVRPDTGRARLPRPRKGRLQRIRRHERRRSFQSDRQADRRYGFVRAPLEGHDDDA